MARTLVLLLPLLLAACGHEAGASSSQSPEVEESVMAGFDEADPAASMRSMELGESRSLLRFERLHADLGELLQHTEHLVSFPFRVDGEDPAAITGIQPTCGCTGAEILVGGEPWPLGEPIPAGSEAEIRATFSTQNFHHEKPSSVLLRGNAANMPITLGIRAFIRPIFEPNPGKATFGEVSASELRQRERSIEVEVLGAEPFEVLAWESQPQGIRIEDLSKAGSDGEPAARHVFKVTLERDAPIGRIYGAAAARTTLDSTLEVLIYAEVLGPVRYFPERRVTFGMQEAGVEAVRTLRIVATEAGAEVPEPQLSLEGDPQGVFSWDAVRKDEGSELRVRIRVRADAPTGRHAGLLRLEYPEGSGLEAVQFPVSVIVRQTQ